MTPRPAATAYSRLCGHIVRGVEAVLFVLLALLVVTVWIQVAGRLALNHSPMWTVDYATLFLVWATFLGAAVALRRSEHFTIDVVGSRYRRWRRVTDVLSQLAVLAILGVLTVAGAVYTADSAGRLSGMTEVSMSFYVAAVPVGSALMLLFTVEHLVRALAGTGQDAAATESEGTDTDV